MDIRYDVKAKFQWLQVIQSLAISDMVELFAVYPDRVSIPSKLFSYDQYNRMRSLIGGHVKSVEDDDKSMQYAGPSTYRKPTSEQDPS